MTEHPTLGEILRVASLSELDRDPLHGNVVSSLPPPVQNFCSAVEKNFDNTVKALLERAAELYDAAEDLRERARRLQAAGPNLRAEIEETIAFERQCHARQQSLALVKVNGG